MSPARTIATVGGIGDMPFAPGTWGSLVAIPLAWGLHALGGFVLVLMATCVLFVAGLWATRAYLAGRLEDPSEVVIDEVVGMLIALWPLSFGMDLLVGNVRIPAGMEAWPVWMPVPQDWIVQQWDFPWPGWVIGFFLFRFFDIVKPPPVSWADRMKTPLGVMLDDVLAGVLAAVIAAVAAAVAHGWF